MQCAFLQSHEIGQHLIGGAQAQDCRRTDAWAVAVVSEQCGECVQGQNALSFSAHPYYAATYYAVTVRAAANYAAAHNAARAAL